MQIRDRLTLDAPRRTSDGRMAVRARAARTGIYDYLASEIGAPSQFKPTDRVKVYRDGADVFDEAAARSFIGRPITNDHPAEAVTVDNWRDHARGTIMGAMRDGEHLAFDLLLTDASAIKAIEDGKRELSNGYSCDLDWTPGTAPDGTQYDARQTNIVGNHVALVDRGRAGSDCAIQDGKFAACDANTALVATLDTTPKGHAVKKLVIDGLQVDLSDADAVGAAIAKLQDQNSEAQTALADAQAKTAEANGKIAALEKQLADAKAASSAEALDARVAERAALVADAKALVSTIATDGKSDADIRREVVAATLGDAATDMEDAEISGAFKALRKSDVSDANKVVSINPQIADNAMDKALEKAGRKKGAA